MGLSPSSSVVCSLKQTSGSVLPLTLPRFDIPAISFNFLLLDYARKVRRHGCVFFVVLSDVLIRDP